MEHPGVLKDPAKVRESWHSVYGGSKKAGKVAVLEEGMKYQQIGIPPESLKMRVLSGKRYNPAKDILRGKSEKLLKYSFAHVILIKINRE